jgi:hypothetical protein
MPALGVSKLRQWREVLSNKEKYVGQLLEFSCLRGLKENGNQGYPEALIATSYVGDEVPGSEKMRDWA